MGDIMLYARTKHDMTSQIHTSSFYINDTEMALSLDKCDWMVSKRINHHRRTSLCMTYHQQIQGHLCQVWVWLQGKMGYTSKSG